MDPSHPRLVAVGFFVLVTVLSGCLSFSEEPIQGGEISFPVDAPTWTVGDVWSGNSELRIRGGPGSDFDGTVKSTDEFTVVSESCDKDCYRVRKDSDPERTEGYTEYWRVNKRTLRWELEEEEAQQPGYPFPLVGEDSGTINEWNYTVGSIQTVEVPAGTYWTVRVDYHDTAKNAQGDDADLEVTQFYAPSVGRTIQRSEIIVADDGPLFDRQFEALGFELRGG